MKCPVCGVSSEKKDKVSFDLPFTDGMAAVVRLEDGGLALPSEGALVEVQSELHLPALMACLSSQLQFKERVIVDGEALCYNWGKGYNWGEVEEDKETRFRERIFRARTFGAARAKAVSYWRKQLRPLIAALEERQEVLSQAYDPERTTEEIAELRELGEIA